MTDHIEKTTVHIVKGGLPLCSFTRVILEKWPKGDTYIWGHNLKDIEDSTCYKCKREWELQKASKPTLATSKLR